MKTLNLLAALLFCTTFLFSCKKEQEKIDPADANALQSVLVIPGGELVSGDLPSPTGSTTSPVINGNQSSGVTSSGGQAAVPFTFTSRAGYNNCYARVSGATNGFFRISGNNAANSGNITIPINIPANVAGGQFCVEYSIADAQGRNSNIRQFCITVVDNSSSGGTSGTGSGSFTVAGQTYSGIAISQPASTSSTGIDVVIASTSGSSFIIYNMPTGSSGSSTFRDGYSQNGLWGATFYNNGIFMATKAGGTLTKTAANKFTFSCTVYDLNTNQTASATGNGTY